MRQYAVDTYFVLLVMVNAIQTPVVALVAPIVPLEPHLICELLEVCTRTHFVGACMYAVSVAKHFRVEFSY